MKDIVSNLRNYLKSIFPDFNCNINFYPSVNLSRGHLSSDALLLYAREIRKSPLELSQVLTNIDNENYSLDFNNGHINLFWKKTNFAFDLEQTAKPVKIIIPEIKADFEIRTRASAEVQYLLGRNDFDTEFVECKRTDFSVDYLMQFADDAAFINVWIPPKFFPRQEFNRLYHALVLNGSADAGLHCYEKFFIDLPDQDLLDAFKTDNLHKQAAFMLATSRKAEDLSLAEAILPQKNNLFWYLDSMSKRLEQLLSNQKPEFLEFDFGQLARAEQKLFLRVKYYQFFLTEAVTKGKVREFLDIIFGYLDETSLFFNNPNFRYRLEQGNLEDYEKEIISGVFALNKAILGKLKVTSH